MAIDHPLYDDCECSDAWEHTQVLREMDAKNMISKSEAMGCAPQSSQIFYPTIPPFPIPEINTKVQTILSSTSPTPPEIYRSDLSTIAEVMELLGDIGAVSGVFEAEIRVKVDNAETWIVIGYGESGDPAIIRFDA